MHKNIIKLKNISKQYNDEIKLLENISFSVANSEKIGLVGNNGSGKTTLLKIMAGLEKPDQGSIEIKKGFKISYLSQKIDSQKSIFEFLNLGKNFKKAQKLFLELSLEKLNTDLKINTLSGGEKTKVGLIKIILENNPIVFLDEPTNNLDKESILFLEKYILNSKQTFLIVSHNRSFLDNTVEKIFFQDSFINEFKIYSGNYSDFVQTFESQKQRQKILYFQNQKQKRNIQKEIQRATQKTKLDKKKDYSKDNDKYINFNITQSVQKKMANTLKAKKTKLQRFEEKENFKEKRYFDFEFKTNITANAVLDVSGLYKEFGNKKIGPVSFYVQKKDRVFLDGKNGSGKTTILKMILGQIQKSSGEVKFFPKTKTAYLSQSLNQNQEQIVFDFLERQSHKSKTEIINILEKIGIDFEIVKNKIKELSEGQKLKVFIADVVLSDYNLLILDEPTNNIDLEVLEKFEQALVEYNGSIIFTSHDKYFIQKLKPNKTILIH
ncbi:hypothetical protein CSB11_00370 [Candidatus Campbellbacteria bacterium]|nr:MAG: hypothetical protein CSB11_00370 [Candidatus Campbellbacteria bacterium]